MADLAALSAWFWVIFAFGVGLCFGSFGNVVIYRLPEGNSVVHPGSACPHCGHKIKAWENIPVLSWILLKAKCSNCSEKISIRYPIVELITGLLFAAVVYKVGIQWVTLEYLIFVFGLVVVCFIDIDHMILPDKITLPGMAIGLVGAAINPEREFLDALYGLLAGGGFLWAIAYVYLAFTKRDGMGGGDIKLLGWMGAVLGWKAVPFIIMCSSILGSVVGVTLAMKSKDGLKSVIPFGPYLAIGALLYLFFGMELIQWYLDLFLIQPPSVN